jgi:S-adenosylmethionine synthetase
VEGRCSGKDPWRLDRAGALRARQVAVAMMETGFVREARVTFAWGPRDRRPSGVVLKADGRALETATVGRWLRRFDPSLAATHEELGLARVNWENCARAGHVGRHLPWDSDKAGRDSYANSSSTTHCPSILQLRCSLDEAFLR